ncbi:MAG: nicotinate-nucleotide diphosphorylase (carboxylating), partial [Acidobacteriota bacterium]
MSATPLYPHIYRPLIDDALREDLGRAGDLTSDAVVPLNLGARGDLRARREGRIAGLAVALEVFRRLDPTVEVDIHVDDGRDIGAGQVAATVRGLAREMLSAERTALNLMGRLSGIATVTRDMVRAVTGTRAR